MHHDLAHISLPLLPVENWMLPALVLLVLAGLASSLHCLAMCGSLAVAASRARCRRFGPAGTILYTLGRLTCYMTIGAVAGTLGQSIWVFATLTGLQGAVAILAGAALLLAGMRFFGAPLPGTSSTGLVASGFSALTGPLRQLVPPSGPGQAWLLGVLNGLLPCSVVYGFLPAALAAGTPVGGALALGAVGLGTVPMMVFAGSIAGLYDRLRGKINRPAADRQAEGFGLRRLALSVLSHAPAWLAILMGGVLIARGAATLFQVA